MGRADALWRQAQPEVRAMEGHPFVMGLASGTLPKDRFLFYIGQDAFFLDAFCRAYALALAKAPDGQAMQTMAGLLQGALSELALHETYAARWGADLHPDPSPATSAYTDFLLRLAYSGPAGHIVAAMTPCMRLYAHLGRHVLSQMEPQTPYADWAQTYASDDFFALASSLEALVDRLDDATDAIGEAYHRAMRLEHAFFDQAWGGDKGRFFAPEDAT